jgi:hypothetical protein
MSRPHAHNTNALGRTLGGVSVEYELGFPCAQVPELHAPVMRTRYDPVVVVRHSNGGDPILHTES